MNIPYLKKENIFYFIALMSYFLLQLKNKTLFTDESDNIAGGWLISQGFVLYKDFFSHHMPFAYYFAGFLSSLGVDNIEGMRLGMFFVILFFWVLIIFLFKNTMDYKIICLLIILHTLAQSILEGYQILGIHFSAYAILILFLYMFYSDLSKLRIYDKIIIAILIYITITSLLVSILPVIIFYLFYLYKQANKFKKAKEINKLLFEEIKFILLIIFPFILTLLYFYYHNALTDFLKQAFLFNSTYYSNFVDTEKDISFNLFENIKNIGSYFFNRIFNYYWFTIGVFYTLGDKSFFEAFLVITNALVSFVFYKKKGLFFIIFYYFLLFSLVIRNGAMSHLYSYFLLSFFNTGLVLMEIFSYLTHKGGLVYLIKAKLNWKESISLLYIFLFFGVFLGQLVISYRINNSSIQNNIYYFYNNYLISSLTRPDDKIWVIPLEPLLYFENKRMPASQYFFYLPWQAASKEINKKIINDLIASKPPLIIIENTSIWNYELKDYGRTVLSYIEKNYQPLNDMNPTFYLLNNRREELLQKLRNKQTITKFTK